MSSLIKESDLIIYMSNKRTLFQMYLDRICLPSHTKPHRAIMTTIPVLLHIISRFLDMTRPTGKGSPQEEGHPRTRVTPGRGSPQDEGHLRTKSPEDEGHLRTSVT